MPMAEEPSLAEFSRLVGEALALVPEEFRPYLADVAVLVEDQAEPGLLAQLGFPPGSSLFGLYSGVSLARRLTDQSGLPDRIIVYRQPHVRAARDLEDLRRNLARTVIHEVAHHFGIGEERLRQLGWG